MKRLVALVMVTCGVLCTYAQAGERRITAVVTAPIVEQPKLEIVGLELVAESPPDENGRQVLITRMEVDGVAYPLYFVKDEGQEYEPNTEVMLGKTFGVIPSEDDIARFLQNGGGLDIFGIETFAVIHDEVSLEVFSDYIIITLWYRGVIVSAYVSASSDLVREAMETSLADTDNNGDVALPMTQAQKKVIACHILWNACWGPPSSNQVNACISFMNFCAGS